MRKKNFRGLTAVALFAAVLNFSSCSDDSASTSVVNVTPVLNSSFSGLNIVEGTYVFENVNTAALTELGYGTSSEGVVADGLYNVTFSGTAQYEQDQQMVPVCIQGVKQNVEIKGGKYNLSLNVYVQNSSSDFVITEIYLPGSVNPSTGKAYNGDQYFKITNNTDGTLYADGLILLESKFTTTQQFVYSPDVLSEAMAVQAVAQIPGQGKEYPVKAGESIIICDNAINHTEANLNSIDLTKANFEWYTASTSSSTTDVDNPDVPNLNMIFNYTNTIWILNKQGVKAYAIGRFPEGVDSSKYLADYAYNPTYTNAAGTTSTVTKCYRFPNAWIVDAVNVGPGTGFVWNVVDASLDMGHVSLGATSTIANNYGKSIVRKVSYTSEDGRAVYQDTNNSTVDFEAAGSCSLKK